MRCRGCDRDFCSALNETAPFFVSDLLVRIVGGNALYGGAGTVFSDGAGGLSRMLAEALKEMTVVAEAHRRGNFRNGKIGGKQQRGRGFDAVSDQVLLRRNAHLLLKQFSEINIVQIDRGTNGFYLEI